MPTNRFMLIAGEASGDLLAAELVQALKQSPEVRAMPFPPAFFGAGGPKMAGAGVELAVDLTRHSVIGLSDVLKKYRQFKRIFDQLFQLALEREPDVIICVDCFCYDFPYNLKRRFTQVSKGQTHWHFSVEKSRPQTHRRNQVDAVHLPSTVAAVIEKDPPPAVLGDRGCRPLRQFFGLGYVLEPAVVGDN